MMIIIVFLKMMTLVSARPNMLKSFAQTDDWLNETRFWTSVTCQAGRRRSFSLYETPCTGPTENLHNFFEALVTNVQIQCGSTLRTNVYAYCNINRNSFWVEGFSTNPPEIQPELETINYSTERPTYLFPFRDVDVVFLAVENAVQTLINGNIFKDLTILRNILVVMVSEVASKSDDTLRNTIFVLLRRLWREKRVLNVFFAAPFSNLGRRIWFYDPFFKNDTSNVVGKIFGLSVNKILTVDRVKDLKGYTLKIGFFEIPPSAIKLNSPLSYSRFPFTKKNQKFGGIDGNSLTVIAEHMNFKMKIVPPTDGNEFGYVDANGTYLGTIGDAAYHKIDIGFNSMYEKLYTQTKVVTNSVEFTVPIDFDRLCVIVPRAQKIPRWLRFFYYFDSAIWICLGLTLILVSVVWYLLQKSRMTKNFERKMYYHELLLDTFLLLVGVPIKINVSQAEKIILSALLLLGVTVIGMFTGTLYHTFTEEMHYKEMNTLKEVDTSGIDIGTTSPNLRDVFGFDENKDDTDEVKSLQRKFKIFSNDGAPTIEKTAYNRNVAALSRQHSFRVHVHRYIDEDGSSLLHLVDECPRSYYLSYIVPKDSVYIDRLNILIRRLQSAGLPPLWNSVTTNKLVVEESARANLKRPKSTIKSFDLRDMQTAFIIMFMGYILSAFVLIAEICYKRKQKWSKIDRTLRKKCRSIKGCMLDSNKRDHCGLP